MPAPVIFNGISFPFRRGSTSFPAGATDDQLIKESLLQLVLTQNGERIMRPDVGTNALAFIFEPNDVVLEQTLRAEIQAVIAKFEPRVLIVSLRTERKPSQGSVIVHIDYVISASRTSSSVAISLPVP
jgi:phage baseplate assembly protein W